MKDNFDLHSWNLKRYLNENLEQSLKDELIKKYDFSIAVSSNKVSIYEKFDIPLDIFNGMIAHIENKGFKVNKEQSSREFDSDGDRDYYPQIVYSS